MPGANNSASGVAVLLETARVISHQPPPSIGIDMVFFDGEEGPKSLGAGDPNWKALGSPYFAAHLGNLYANRKPEKAVVFDMVCYQNLQLSHELSSLVYAKPEVQWSMNNTLANIGIHVPKLRKRAIAIGEKLGIYRDYPVSKGCTSPFAPIWINAMVSRKG